MKEAHQIENDMPPGEVISLAWSELWMLPLLLMQVIAGLFSAHLARLKQMRRSRPLPANWRDHLEDLREAEWPILVLLAEGARQILSGRPLDLHAIACPEQPEDFQPAMPRNALSVHRRIENLVRFNANPEAYVRRHARRIAASEAARAGDPHGAVSAAGAALLHAVHPVPEPAVHPLADQRARAPP
jgi:hypothetical protein